MPVRPRRQNAPAPNRAALVLATSEARRALPQTSRNFAEQGVNAEPVFFGAHRKPTGVMISYERYIQILDRLDDLAVALEIRRRDRADEGTRLSLDELFAAIGLDRAEVQAEVDVEDGIGRHEAGE